MPAITVEPGGDVFQFAAGRTLLDVLRDANRVIESPCNGNGTCGKCRVKVVSGMLPEPSEAERKHLSAEELAGGVRLACLVEPEGDVCVELACEERRHEVLTTGVMPKFAFAPDTEKRLVTVERPSLDDQTPFEDQVCRQLGVSCVDAQVLAGVPAKPGEYTAVLNRGRVVALELGDTTAQLYGLAIDIGTTTVVCELVDMNDGAVLADSSQVNAQKTFGLDVLTRITFEFESGQEAVESLQSAIVDSLNDMIGEACREAGVSREHIYEATVGANCTMMHMLLGIDARSIGHAPFAPAFTRSKDLAAAEIGLDLAPGARLYCLPHVSAYIGADIVAGAYVCELWKQAGNVLFIDIGTNGEIVLASRGELLSCSCAAGPALEGMNISAGMRAAEGAIEEITITENGNELSIIGGREAAGLCGSGILAVMRELLKWGFVRKNGAFVKAESLSEDDCRRGALVEFADGKRAFLVTDNPERLLVTQGDVRQVQLAKGAILSGFVALLEKAGIAMGDLDRVIIAGQFGAHLSPNSITGTGILPLEVEDIIEYAGNTSKTGAYMALMSGAAKRDMERLAKQIGYMELGATKDYDRLFSKSMIFPDYSR